jgi:homoserine O-acetyltransferase/O-succinyltransferase
VATGRLVMPSAKLIDCLRAGEGLASELRALVGVEYLRLAVARQGVLQRLDAERRLHRNRQLQAYEWAQSYPETVERIIPVIASASAEPFLIAWLDMWAQPIRLDPKWNNGDYYDKEPPTEGLKAAFKVVILQANSWEWARKTFGTASAEDGKDPAKAFTNKFKVEAFLDQAAAARAVVTDANHFLYLCKAAQLASVDPAKIKAPTLVLYAPNDLIFYEPIVEDTIQNIAAAGTSVESGTLPGPNGHLNGIAQIALGADKISAFLAR